MKSSYKALATYIEPVNQLNDGMEVNELLGISNQKFFQNSHTNTIGIDLQTYRIVRTNQFAYNRATTRNGDKISIALRQGNDCIVSPSYRIFRSKDENALNSEYLMMWFRRPEFDRYARFKSHGSAHEFFEYDQMCQVELPIPHIDKQREIVKEYNVIQNRLALNQQLIQKLEETAQAIYKQWIVEFEFPDENGKPYKSNGGALVWNEELQKEIPLGWDVKNLEETVNIIRGASPRPIEEYMSNDNSGMPWVKISDATACATKYLFETKQFISKEGVPKSRKVKIGTLILSNSASPGLPKFMMIDACVHDGWLIFNDYKGISKELLYNFLLVNRQKIVSSSNGSVFNNLKTEILKQYKIVVPDENILKQATKIFQVLDSQFSIAAKKDYCFSELSKVLYAKMSKGNY
jgi:type I restriction enzyme S subunit